jgi:hypothetical protein
MAKDVHRVVDGYALWTFFAFEGAAQMPGTSNCPANRGLLDDRSAEPVLDTHLAKEQHERRKRRMR